MTINVVAKFLDSWRMFRDAHSFNQPLNKWNVSNVETMTRMFRNAHSFNQPLNKWNVSNVTDMHRMFDAATSFNQPLHAPWYEDTGDY